MAALAKDTEVASPEQQISISARGLTVNLPFDMVKDIVNQRSEQELERLKRHIMHLQNRNTFLLRLPAELRNNIYELVIRAHLQNPEHHSYQQTLANCVKPPLLSTSQQLRSEGQLLYFGKFMTTERYDRSRDEWSTLPAEEASQLALCPLKLPMYLKPYLNLPPRVRQTMVRNAYRKCVITGSCAYLIFSADGGNLPPVWTARLYGCLWEEQKVSGHYNS
ncbi:hypothetical protein LTR37_014541 [Vermiconidia calcicola]|uniref:Uncharacterized protein n=1 Tax=Vermiconidia calcicola TaxID=1690605 RepID=A0ACC3MW46_9PEZI|nr:hypothetical protein LTR37_014541 [Vermiconidia calcicola]